MKEFYKCHLCEHFEEKIIEVGVFYSNRKKELNGLYRCTQTGFTIGGNGVIPEVRECYHYRESLERLMKIALKKEEKENV